MPKAVNARTPAPPTPWIQRTPSSGSSSISRLIWCSRSSSSPSISATRAMVKTELTAVMSGGLCPERLGGGPVPRQEFVQAADQMVADAVEHRRQVGLGIETRELAVSMIVIASAITPPSASEPAKR
ncbi:hypothetical protein N825_22775 [Skermanella stibiiresistens SB22]|uniref:Uncharacterized protein n=1 Tax=Skermanella stibiiresistens SB22 TaxID=1385369 RepID=W9GT38_9PROT|nr:hypothetical protein N825_22775 [Skermanella stibiiresistens SB22]